MAGQPHDDFCLGNKWYQADFVPYKMSFAYVFVVLLQLYVVEGCNECILSDEFKLKKCRVCCARGASRQPPVVESWTFRAAICEKLGE